MHVPEGENFLHRPGDFTRREWMKTVGRGVALAGLGVVVMILGRRVGNSQAQAECTKTLCYGCRRADSCRLPKAVAYRREKSRV